MTVEALQFFQRLQAHLNSKLPGPSEMAAEIKEIVRSAKTTKDRRHKAFPEGAFLSHFVAPNVHEFLVTHYGLPPADARQALLSESYRNLKGIASGTPAREKQHPFGKLLGTTTQAIGRRWMGRLKTSPLVQSCPDLALRAPFPYTTVIEGKLWRSGGSQMALTGLVQDVYQAFFYRGLSRIPGSWDYDYACLLAFDATREGSLWNAWESLDESVRTGFWEGANIYVMILRGQA